MSALIDMVPTIGTRRDDTFVNGLGKSWSRESAYRPRAQAAENPMAIPMMSNMMAMPISALSQLPT